MELLLWLILFYILLWFALDLTTLVLLVFSSAFLGHTLGRTHRVTHWVRTRSFWQRLRCCFSHTVIPHATQRVQPKERVLYACHPHGMCAMSTILTFVHRDATTQAWIPHRRLYVSVLALIWKLPVLRDLYQFLGCTRVDWLTIERHLDRRHAVVLIPEGVHGMGAPLLEPDERDDRFLERAYAYNRGYRRRGKVRLGFHRPRLAIVPVYCHGEESLYLIWQNEWQWITRVRRFFLGWIQYPFPTVFLGPWPNQPLQTFLGPPLRCRRREKLAAYKARYWKLLETLKDEAKAYNCDC
jgi:hypothetical protein